MKSVEPIYGEEYLCYVGEEFIGMATFTADPNIGDSFIRLVVHKVRGLEEEVLIPDNWILSRSFG